MSRFSLFSVTCAIIFAASAGVSAGILADVWAETRGGVVSALAALVAGIIIGAATRLADRIARSAREKAESERTLIDRGIIETERRIAALNREQLAAFLENFVLERFDVDGYQTLYDRLDIADDLLTSALEAFERRNPELARALRVDPKSMRELLTAEIQRQVTGLR